MYFLKYALYKFYRCMLVQIFQDKRKRVRQNFDKYCEKVLYYYYYYLKEYSSSFHSLIPARFGKTKDGWKGAM